MDDRYDRYARYDKDAYARHDDYLNAEDADHRLRHLVFLDGQLVDSFTQTVSGSDYVCLALEADATRRARALPPPAPEHERVLTWLDAAVGGRRALLDLDDAPLEDVTSEVADDHPAYDAAADLLERIALDLFRDDEVWAAAHHVLDRVWADDPELLASRRTVPQVAGGILWVVGRANGLFGPAPAVRQKDVQRALHLSQSLSTPGRVVERCLRRLDIEPCTRPWGAPAVEPAGDARVLTSITRRDLVRWRDRAIEAQRRHRADQVARHVLPTEVE